MSASLPRCLAFLGLVSLVGTACVDERVVYRDAPRFSEPPAAAGNFLGYARAGDTVTTCGTCHISFQNQWRGTAHARAWSTLAAAGAQAQAACESCHSVSDRGNAVTNANVGWPATRDPRYRDVQCESCHGPGLAHAMNPTRSNVPLASMKAHPTATDGCGECHSGTHHPYVAEWAISGHGTLAASRSAMGNPACMSCHQGQAALRAFGVQGNYKERGLGTGDTLTIVCAVCHEPHRNEFPGQLRASVRVPDENENLCMRCHHKRGLPDLTAQNRGPHSPQGPLLLGEAGWWPPNIAAELARDRIIGTHGPGGNPGLCTTCHVDRFTVTDRQTGQFQLQVVGHRFLAIACIDANGAPTTAQNCADSERTFRTCTGSGCHGSQNAARSAFATARVRLTNLAAELNRLIALVPASERNPNDGRYSTAEGSWFNAQLGAMRGTAAHNPFLAEQLLIASIQQMQRDYGVRSETDLTPRLRHPAGVSLSAR